MGKKLTLSTSLNLARGAKIKNRLYKAAMSEQLGDGDHNPGSELARLPHRQFPLKPK